MTKICLIGYGKMGQAMLAGWRADRDLNLEVHVIDPALDIDMLPPAIHGHHDLSHLDESLDFDLYILAVKPQMMEQAITPLANRARPKTAYLSIAAGLTTEQLSIWLGGTPFLLRAMPNMPASIGKGITALYARDEVSGQLISLAKNLLSACGEVVMLKNEADMDIVTALSGSGPAYIFLLAEILETSALKYGLAPDLARQIARTTISGAGALLEADPTEASLLRQNVTSKGGTTEAALTILMGEDNLQKLFDQAIEAARARAGMLARTTTPETPA